MATLKATIASGYQKPLVVFQPHRVTRTTALIESFATSFGSARDVLVTDIYSAGEANPTGLSGEVVADAIRRYDPSQSVFYTPGFNDVVARLEDLVDESDVILILGAGDVGLVASMLPGGLK
jgi:UDP-N-acetylmuramate--alanine ligase